jgi:hypothetical protein
MAILEEQTLADCEEQLTLFRQEFHVSPQVWPGSEEARQMSVGSGRQCSMWFSQSDPLGAFSKILLESSHWTNSEEYCYVWERLDTQFGCSGFQLTALEPGTGDTESSLYVTPIAKDAQEGSGKGHHLESKADSKAGWRLKEDVSRKLWPTPIQRDWKSCSSNGNQTNARPLSEVAGLTGSGSLNPRFVCQLMGFEADHTDLKHWETLSSRNKPTRFSKQSQK